MKYIFNAKYRGFEARDSSLGGHEVNIINAFIHVVYQYLLDAN